MSFATREAYVESFTGFPVFVFSVTPAFVESQAALEVYRGRIFGQSTVALSIISIIPSILGFAVRTGVGGRVRAGLGVAI